MTRRVLRLSALALFLSVAPAVAHAEDAFPRIQDSFTGGIDFGGGPWLSMSPTYLLRDISSICAVGGSCDTNKNDLAGARTYLGSQTGIASAVTKPFNAALRGDLTLHLGWMHVDPKWGRFTLEGAYQSPGLNPFGAVNTSVGAGSFIQGRVSWFFLRMAVPDTGFDLGIEGGGGSAFLGDYHFYSLNGGTAEAAVRAIYFFNPYVSIEAYYRFTLLFISTADYRFPLTSLTEYVTLNGFISGVNELGIGLNIYVGAEPRSEDDEGSYRTGGY